MRADDVHKSTFSDIFVSYLGHLISSDSVSADLEKNQGNAVACPDVSTTLCRFLTRTRYYHRLVTNYGTFAASLTTLLKNNAFQWTEEATRSFKALKSTMTTTPVLALLDFDNPFVVETDASEKGFSNNALTKRSCIGLLSLRVEWASMTTVTIRT